MVEHPDPDPDRPGGATTSPPPSSPPPEAPADARRRHAHRAKLYVELLLLVALLIAVALLAVDNQRRVELSWLVGETEASVVWIVLGSAVLGWLTGIVTAVIVRRRTRRPR